MSQSASMGKLGTELWLPDFARGALWLYEQFSRIFYGALRNTKNIDLCSEAYRASVNTCETIERNISALTLRLQFTSIP